MRVKVKFNHLNAVLAAAASYSERYYLNGFYVDREAERIVGTDGHRLISVPYTVLEPPAESEKPDHIWTFDPKLQKTKPLPKKGRPEWVIVDTVAKEAAIYDSDPGEYPDTPCVDLNRREPIYPIDGRYPDYKRVMPNGDASEALESIAFNPLLVSDIYSALKADAALFTFHGDDRAISVDFAPGEEGKQCMPVDCVVMPMRW